HALDAAWTTLRHSVHALFSAQRAEELADFSQQEIGLLHRGEVATARHLGPTLDVETGLGPAAWAARQLLREHRDADGRLLHLGPATAVLATRLVIHVCSAGDAVGRPVKHDVREQLVLRVHALDVAAAVAPRPELLDDP